MGSLGLAIYPLKTDFESIKNYLNLASELKYERIFMSFLEVEDHNNRNLERFRKVIDYGNKLGMQTTLDINPDLLKKIKANENDFSFFLKLGVHSIRLDLGFDGSMESKMTRNPQNIKIDVNISSGTKLIDNIMNYQPKRSNITSSHNFYPMRYSGLSLEHFKKTTQQFLNYNIDTTAFITSQTASVGPWPLNDGLCTLEDHRDLSIGLQVLHYRILDNIDDLIIGNAFASEAELRCASKLFHSPYILIPIQIEENISDIEKKIIFDQVHQYRGDNSSYIIRSTQPRIAYKNYSIPYRRDKSIIKTGQVTIGNDNFLQYKGELQIHLKTITDKMYRNPVGKLIPNTTKILEDLKPWSTFKFYNVDESEL